MQDVPCRRPSGRRTTPRCRPTTTSACLRNWKCVSCRYRRHAAWTPVCTTWSWRTSVEKSTSPSPSKSSVNSSLLPVDCVCCSSCFAVMMLSWVLWRCRLGGRKGIRPVKNWVVGCWRGYLSRTSCRFAYGPADATATHLSKAPVNPDSFYLPGFILFWYRLTRVVLDDGVRHMQLLQPASVWCWKRWFFSWRFNVDNNSSGSRRAEGGWFQVLGPCTDLLWPAEKLTSPSPSNSLVSCSLMNSYIRWR